MSMQMDRSSDCSSSPLRRLLGACLLCACIWSLAAGAWAQVESVAQLEKKFGIEVVLEKEPFPVANDHGPIAGQDATLAEVERYLPLLLFEFGAYPPELVKRTKLKRIVLCKRLSFAGQFRNAIPDYQHDTLYLEVVRGMASPGYMRRVIHHEFFHIIDWKDDGLVYRDDAWGKLNPKGFRYGTGGKNAQGDATMSLLTDEFPGFLTKYATTGVEEDKAELYAHMLVDPKLVRQRVAADEILAAKCERMQQLLSRFCKQVDAEFWERMSKLAKKRSNPK